MENVRIIPTPLDQVSLLTLGQLAERYASSLLNDEALGGQIRETIAHLRNIQDIDTKELLHTEKVRHG